MAKKFKKKSDKLYAVVGLGRFGFALAEELAAKGCDVMVVDRDRNRVEAADFTDNAFVVDEMTRENLEATGIAEADVAVICIGDKIDVSILTTLTVIRLGVPKVISKASSAEQGEVLAMLGAEVVYPERDMALRLAGKLISPNILEYISLSDEIDIMEIKLSEKAEGKTVVELNVRSRYGLNIIARRHGDTISTDILPDMVLHADDSITVIGKTDSIHKFENDLQ
ncbi:MAG: TrkA family potassium uptake protein [Ruminococcaceae bacterium]|nr:TrkA family potassium uptake protein [Oscillospiraceae bacterium]